MAERFDPVSLEILWSRLINITEECWVTIWRTAFSMIIGEAQDFGCELLDANGESLAHSPRSMPVFNLTLPRAVRVLLERFPPATLEEGDLLATNDPWICAGHLFDLALVSPVFRSGRLVGLVGSIAHCSDVGGTLDSLAVREIYEEGLQIPPMKLFRRGEPNAEVLALIRQNVRKGDMVIGDIQAQLSANRVGAQRLLRFMDEYRLDDLAELAEVIQSRSERAMREAIQAVPDGEYFHELEFEAVDRRLTLPVRVEVRGDELWVDWAGAPPQLDRGAVNCTYSYTAAHTVYALKCILTPEIPSNAGCFRPIHITAPEGSILNCSYPAGVNLRTMTGWYCAPALFGALAPAMPAQVQGFTGMPMGAGTYGLERDGSTFNDHLFQGGGQGASAHSDGKSAILFPTSAANTPVEMFENRTPLLVERKELIPDSGGAGRHRGGLGQRVQVRKLYDDGQQALVSLHPQGIEVETGGHFGGRAGRLAAIRLADGGSVRDHAALGGLADLRRASQLLTIELAGGSGYGDAGERPVTEVQRDLDEGLVTEEGLDLYGCRVLPDGRVARDVRVVADQDR
jgi:N-methylhydantoinase B/oxoprolinase/acetone carboxylase alpha subunit